MVEKDKVYLAWFWSISFVIWSFVFSFKGCHYDNVREIHKYEIEKLRIEKGIVDTSIQVIEE